MSATAQLVQYLNQLATRGNSKKLVLSLILLVLYKYRSHALGTRPRRDLKQPRALPLVGHMFTMSTIPGPKLNAFYLKMYDQFGPVWAVSLPGIGRMIQGDSPEIVEHVLKTNFWAYEKGPILKGAMNDLFGDGNKERKENVGFENEKSSSRCLIFLTQLRNCLLFFGNLNRDLPVRWSSVAVPAQAGEPHLYRQGIQGIRLGSFC